jgi:ATP-dependent helicase HepA
MNDPFHDFCLGAQAVRRSVEREIAGLGGAMGVAAIPYPHQLQNVQRILGDTRVRHLIADEVGLGKTVQALMVLNALRLQNPGHRALILVPENLAPQWYQECQSRGHLNSSDRAPDPERSGQHVRLVYPEQLASTTEIDPSLYDLLIVDEIQRLQSNVRQRIADAAGDFRQLLLLSATPKIEDKEAFRQLLAILEPERMAFAARTSDEPEQLLHEREVLAERLLKADSADGWNALELAPPPVRKRRAAVASTWSVLRRVTHARRRDYPDLLPQRSLHRIAIEPTADEVERQSNVWAFIGDARQRDKATDLARLGQVALRSPRALAERINILANRDQRDPRGFLQEASRHLDPSNGDSRLEALVDLLVDIWNEDPEQKVLVVAEDNPTVDTLERLIPQILPEIGPRGRRRPLSLAVKRNRDASATSDLVELFDEHDETLGGFIGGEDQLLIAGDVAQVGLNLQHARKLIFFSMPWSPAAVEQWIGRLDRLGSAALADETGERAIDIYAIYQKGQVDERVVSVLADFGIFRRSIKLDGDEINEVSQHIVDAALAPHSGNWQGLAREARAFGNDEEDSFASLLSPALPWQKDQAVDLAERFDRTAAIGPFLRSSSARRAIVRIEVGLRSWMRLMDRAHGIKIWTKRDPEDPGRAFRLLRYYRPPFAVGRTEPRFALPGVDPEGGKRYAYLDGRQMLDSPPTPTVSIDDDPAAPLHFLDHGNPVHEALLGEWTRFGKEVPKCLRVQLPDGHALAGEAKGNTYLLALLSWIPAREHVVDVDRSAIFEALGEARTDTERKPFHDALQQMEEDLRADRRWLNSQLSARLDVLAARLDNGGWQLAETAVAHAFCSPWNESARGKDIVLATGQPVAPSAEIKAAYRAGLDLILGDHKRRHQRSLAECADLAAEIASRRYLVEAEAADLVRLREAALTDAEAQGMETSEQGFTRSRFRSIRNARDAAVIVRDARLARLDGISAAVQEPRFSEYKTMLVTLA